MKRIKPSYQAIVAAALVLAACDGTPVTVSGDLPDALATPATPPPTGVPTPPRPTPTGSVATPPPTAQPTPATPNPDASMADVQATPDGMASGATSPAPGSGYQKTGTATDLAVSGPAYFVLSTKPNPTTTSDLLFTRDGRFTFVHDTAGSLSLWRLRHQADNFFVVGYTLSGGTAAGAPDETGAADHAELATTWTGENVVALGLFLDADRNPDAPGDVSFDFTGRMKAGESAPRGSDGNSVQAYVALAQFGTPGKLVAQPGFTGVYKYAAAAGTLNLGVAVSGDGHVVGNGNLILTGTLEEESATSAAKP